MSGAIRIGTSGWSYEDWVGPFYPAGTDSGDFLPHYAAQFDTVEVDSTFYRPPSRRMVQGWTGRTPEHFAFALKVPNTITHEKVLLDCDADMENLLTAALPLGPKLKCLLLQFGYFNRSAFAGPGPFFDRLTAFLIRFAARAPLACEIRNKNWLTKDYFELLRAHHTSAALVEHAWLPPIDELAQRFNVVTGPYAYVRLIGDRDGIEKTTKTWEKVVIDRSADLARVADALRQIAARADVFVFVNNHYSGHAPVTCRALRTALAESPVHDARD